MWRSVKIGLGIIIVAAVLALPALAQTSGLSVSATITNENCPDGFLLSQVVWLRSGLPIGLQILQVLIRQGQSYTVTQELSAMPTEVVIRGSSGGQPIEVRAPIGQTVSFECGQISTTFMPGPPQPPSPPSPPTPPPQPIQVPFPPGMPRLTLSPGMSPTQLLSTLQAAGAQVVIQGSQDKPKLGDAEDPILVGALPGGFSALGLWVSTAGGSLRVAVAYDRPSAFVWLWIVPVPNFWNSAMAWSPWPGGGISVSLDRPQAYQPMTQWGNAPVPGTLFFVLLVKWEASTWPFPFVLTLSN